MIHRFVSLFESWHVEPDPDRKGYTHIRGVQRWDALTLTAVGAILLVQAGLLIVSVFGIWGLLPPAVTLCLMPFARRFHLLVTPYGAVCRERLFGYTVSTSFFPLDAEVELEEDFWEGPDHPCGVTIWNPETYEHVLLGPAYNEAAQNDLLTAIASTFQSALEASAWTRRFPSEPSPRQLSNDGGDWSGSMLSSGQED